MEAKSNENKDLADANAAMQRLGLGTSTPPPPEAGPSDQAIHRSSVSADSHPIPGTARVVPVRRTQLHEEKGARHGPKDPDSRPIVLFNLNGTLTSHISQPRSSGITTVRPGTHHLRRLQVKSPNSLSVNGLDFQSHPLPFPSPPPLALAQSPVIFHPKFGSMSRVQ